MTKNSKRNKPPVPLSASNKPHNRQVVAQHYQGPIPPPDIMEALNKLLPGAAERIFVMAEKEQNAVIEDRKQQQDRADKIVKDRHIENMLALFMAFAVCISFCIGGVFLVLHGYELTGSTLLGSTLAAVVGSFLYGKRKK